MSSPGAVPLCFPDNHIWDPSKQSLSISREIPARKLLVCEEGLNILKEIDTPVVVICITGPSGSGKSYLLSQMQNGGNFPVHHEMNTSTIGIWITSTSQQILKNGGEARLVFLDTEGLGSLYNGESNDDITWERKLFTLGLLMSSYFIFNSPGTPSFDDLLQLKAVTSFADFVKSTNHPPRNSGPRAQQTNSPDFFWLVRDEFRQPNLRGQPCNWVTLIKSILLQRRVNDCDDEKERIRKAIIHRFGKIDARSMPFPSNDPEVMRNLDSSKIRPSDLNPAFIRSLQSTTNKVIASAKVKQIAGTAVRGKQLAVLLGGYIDALNRDTEVIDVERSWRSMVATNYSSRTPLKDKTDPTNEATSEYRQRARGHGGASVCVEQESASGEILENVRQLDTRISIRLAITSYQTKMLELQLPCSSAVFEDKHKSAVSEAGKVFLSTFQGADATVRSHYHNELMTTIENERSSFFENNCCLSVETCEQIVQNLSEKHLTPLTDNLGICNDYDDLVSAVGTIFDKYDKEAIGPKARYVKSQAEAKMKSILVSSQEKLIERGIRKSKEWYKYSLGNLKLPASEEDLDRTGRNSHILAMKRFDQYTKGVPSDLWEKELSKVKSEIDDIFSSRKLENRDMLRQEPQRYRRGIPSETGTFSSQKLDNHTLLRQKHQQFIAELKDKLDLGNLTSADEVKLSTDIILELFLKRNSGAAADEVYTETKAKYAEMIRQCSARETLSAAVAVGGVVAAVGLAAFGIAKLFGGNNDEEEEEQRRSRQRRGKNNRRY